MERWRKNIFSKNWLWERDRCTSSDYSQTR